MVKLSSILVPGVVALLLAGCAGGSSSSVARHPTGASHEPWYIHSELSPLTDTRHIVVKKLPHYGIVLTDGKGYALYAFVPAEHGAACTGSCATAWPPFTLTPEHVLDTSPLLNDELLSVEPKEHLPEHLRVVSYAGRLLHSYVGDTSPLMAKGQGLNSDGGSWRLISPSGKLVTKTL